MEKKDWSFTDFVLDVYKNRGLKALVLIEEDEKFAVAYNGISAAAVMSFILDIFIDNPDIHDNVMEIMQNIELTDQDTDKATIH